VNPEQRALLLAAKLKSLVSNADGSLGWRRVVSGPEMAEPVPFQAGAGLVDAGAATGWVLVAPRVTGEVHIDAMPDATLDKNPRGWLGGAVVWAHRQNLRALHILLDHVAPADSTRVSVLMNPPTLWQINGRDLVPAMARVVEPEPVSEDHLRLFSALITDAGAELVVDHGVIRAEVLGLEVGRVTIDETGVPSLEVGVGKHDRLANAMLGHDRDIAASLKNAVGSVESRRRHDAGTHPANQLARERWLRCIVRAQPSLVGLSGPLHSIESLRPATLKQLDPALLLGEGVLVACSVGVDLDAAIDAATVRERIDPTLKLVLVIPEHDVFDAQRLVVASIPNAEIITAPDTWMSLGQETTRA
jgi:hypothetical protein